MKWLDKLLHPDEQTYEDCVGKYNGLVRVINQTHGISFADQMDLRRLAIKIEVYKLRPKQPDSEGV